MEMYRDTFPFLWRLRQPRPLYFSKQPRTRWADPTPPSPPRSE